MKNIKKLGVLTSMAIITIIFITNCKHKPFPGPELPPVVVDTTHIPPVDTTKHVVKDPCSPDSVYFQKDIWPLIASNCAKSGCHASGSGNDVTYTGYSSVLREVKPGNPSSSKLYNILITSDPGDRMPRGNTPLTQAQIDMIYKWIQQGAKNNTCTDTTCNANQFAYAKNIQPLLSTYCTGCHNGGASGANVNLLNYSGVSAVAANGKLYNTVNHTTGSYAMPLGSAKLSPCQIAQIKNWVDAGYPNN